MSGWIKLHRELVDKAIWHESTPEQKVVLITLLMMANHEEKQWIFEGRKYIAKPGQFVTSLNSIQKKCGKNISIMKIRTAISRFKRMEFLTIESTKQNSLITIINWDVYQGREDKVTKEITINQHTGNKRLTTNKNKECKNSRINKDIVEIVGYLNQVCNTKYLPSSKKTQSLINARLNESFSVDDFKMVIDKKYKEWSQDEKMNKFLRPETLFGTKFESYLNQKIGGNNERTTREAEKYSEGEDIARRAGVLSF